MPGGRFVIKTPPTPLVLTARQSLTRFGNIPDGLSNTIFFGEKHVPLGQFGVGDFGDCSIYNGDTGKCANRAAGRSNPVALGPTDVYKTNFGSYHAGICQFALGDGSVRAVPVSINTAILALLADRDDGQVIPDF